MVVRTKGLRYSSGDSRKSACSGDCLQLQGCGGMWSRDRGQARNVPGWSQVRTSERATVAEACRGAQCSGPYPSGEADEADFTADPRSKEDMEGMELGVLAVEWVLSSALDMSLQVRDCKLTCLLGSGREEKPLIQPWGSGKASQKTEQKISWMGGN